MSPKKILKESKKRLKKKGPFICEEERKKIERQIEEVESALEKKNRAHAKKTAYSLRKNVSALMPKKAFEVVLEYVISFTLAILIALAIRHFVIEPFKIPTGSMIPTFIPGDYILVNKAAYGPRIPFTNIKPFGKYKPDRWDIVVFTTKGLEDASQYPKNFVKRVVGLPGEIMEIREGEIYVNGNLLEKPEYLNEKVLPYGVVQQDNLGRYYLKEPPGQDNSKRKNNYGPIDAPAEIIDDQLRVGSKKVLVADIVQGDQLPLSIDEDGMSVFLNGIYYFNAPDSLECRIETWKYRINLFDWHFWRIPDTNGVRFGGPYKAGLRGRTFEVPDGHYLMLGDNSGRSYDSRAWGFVPYENIKGRVLLKWWPPSRWSVPR